MGDLIYAQAEDIGVAMNMGDLIYAQAVIMASLEAIMYCSTHGVGCSL